MSAKTNGGPAFPAQPIYQHPHGATGMSSQEGMTLRDWFAGQALYCVSQKTNGFDPQWLASTAYIIADAMIAERSK